jgi:hypothetical protein
MAVALEGLQRAYHLPRARVELLFCHEQGSLGDKLSPGECDSSGSVGYAVEDQMARRKKIKKKSSFAQPFPTPALSNALTSMRCYRN